MKSTKDHRANSKFVTITVVLMLATICVIIYNMFQMEYEYFCNVLSTSLTTLKNTTFVNTTKHTKTM
jgi:hypothetical protein